MAGHSPERIRNVVLIGHSHEGKTTLAEAMLFAGGAVPRAGSTDQGTATLDFEPEEQRRRMSVNLAMAFVEHGDVKVNLLDAPGFLDFSAQVAAGLRAADGALIVVSAQPQVPVGTESAWDLCTATNKPRLVVVNKMDKENADYFGAVDALRAALSPRPVALHIPIGAEKNFQGVVDLLHMKAFVATPDGKGGEGPVPEDLKATVEARHSELVEAAAEGDDELLEKYLDEGTLTDAEVERGLREGIVAGRVVPVVCCSATRMLGVRTLLSAICDLLPAPPVDVTGPGRAFVFATSADPIVHRLSYFKVLGGTLRSETHADNLRSGDERLGSLFFPRGREHINATEIGAGDIGAVAKLAHTLTGDTIGERGAIAEPPLELPTPVFRLAIHPLSRGDEDKIGTGLARLAEEDPSLHVHRDEVTHQLVISGQGDVHLDVVLEKLARKYHVEATTELPRVAYRETLAGSARAEGRHVKQSGGHGQYAICTIEASPAGRGEGFTWEDRVFGGSIPQNFRPSVQKGIVDTMAKGVVAGYPMVDVKVALLEGKYHTVDSSDMAFQLAGSLAIRKAAADAHPILLEPVMDVEVRVPDRCLGDIMSDLNGRRGRIAGTEPDGVWAVVRAQVPEAEMLRFALDLRSISQGRGSFSMTYAHHEEVPAAVARPLIEAYAREHAGRE